MGSSLIASYCASSRAQPGGPGFHDSYVSGSRDRARAHAAQLDAGETVPSDASVERMRMYPTPPPPPPPPPLADTVTDSPVRTAWPPPRPPSPPSAVPLRPPEARPDDAGPTAPSLPESELLAPSPPPPPLA